MLGRSRASEVTEGVTRQGLEGRIVGSIWLVLLPLGSDLWTRWVLKLAFLLSLLGAMLGSWPSLLRGLDRRVGGWIGLRVMTHEAQLVALSDMTPRHLR